MPPHRQSQSPPETGVFQTYRGSWINFPENIPPECMEIQPMYSKDFIQICQNNVYRKWCFRHSCVEGTFAKSAFSTHTDPMRVNIFRWTMMTGLLFYALQTQLHIPTFDKLPAPPPFCRNRSAMIKPTRKMSAIPRALFCQTNNAQCVFTNHFHHHSKTLFSLVDRLQWLWFFLVTHLQI